MRMPSYVENIEQAKETREDGGHSYEWLESDSMVERRFPIYNDAPSSVRAPGAENVLAIEAG